MNLHCAEDLRHVGTCEASSIKMAVQLGCKAAMRVSRRVLGESGFRRVRVMEFVLLQTIICACKLRCYDMALVVGVYVHDAM